MSNLNPYLSNCIRRIFNSEINPKKQNAVCNRMADALDAANENGIHTAHQHLQELLKDCESGKYK